MWLHSLTLAELDSALMVEIAIQNSKALHTPDCHRAEDVGSRCGFKDKQVVSQVEGLTCIDEDLSS